MRAAWPLVVLLLPSVGLVGGVVPGRADDAKGGKGGARFEVFGPGYFESNQSGLTGKASHLFFTDPARFGKVFGSHFVPGGKAKLLPKGYFEKHAVAAVIKRGDQTYRYEVTSVRVNQAGTLRVAYKATAEGKAGGTARFASPLIVGVPRQAGLKFVAFEENGKIVDTVRVVAAAEKAKE